MIKNVNFSFFSHLANYSIKNHQQKRFKIIKIRGNRMSSHNNNKRKLFSFIIINKSAKTLMK
jgi:hypothetical protein